MQNALDTGRFPTATFTAESISGLTTPIADGQQVEFQLGGMLDLHGVQKEVTWTVKATRQANVISAIATLDFSFADYDIVAAQHRRLRLGPGPRHAAGGDHRPAAVRRLAADARRFFADWLGRGFSRIERGLVRVEPGSVAAAVNG